MSYRAPERKQWKWTPGPSLMSGRPQHGRATQRPGVQPWEEMEHRQACGAGAPGQCVVTGQALLSQDASTGEPEAGSRLVVWGLAAGTGVIADSRLLSCGGRMSGISYWQWLQKTGNCMLQGGAVGFPGGSDDEESACSAGIRGLIPELGRSPGGGKGNPLQYSGLENCVDRGAWQATVHETGAVVCDPCGPGSSASGFLSRFLIQL